ncbi:Alkaline phosphatase 4 precursor [Allorhodopirellula heiligendammensis]|uniref:Alkaline phosphatase 4 n=2 Tax=Allorhodopirellula heiligendammensis TaxID=2714739 RepID=A0A5C6BVL5_9BACT|nr:Alkaline phosphatase 4 precursor [Allorhodopirellula heiligendammensis]
MTLPATAVAEDQPSTVDRVLDVIKDTIEPAADESPSLEIVDRMRQMQSQAIKEQTATWGRWGNRPNKFSSWTNHSNRLVPLYTFGMTLSPLRERGSFYSNADRMEQHFGAVPAGTLNPNATYHDQIDVYELQQMAFEEGKKHIILMVFDGTDWPTTRAAATYHNRADHYDSGRGRGLSFQDYRGVETDFAFVGTTPRLEGGKIDVNAQTVDGGENPVSGGFDPTFAGPMPWQERSLSGYPIGKDRQQPHTVTDSAASATSLMAGIKTYNAAINVAVDGSQCVPIGRQLQQQGFRVGVVTSVPVSHATPASAYANNVHRGDYQDIGRDLVGRPSISHRQEPLPGVDVLIGGGWGEGVGKDGTQGEDFLEGNKYLHESDLRAVALKPGETDPHRRKYVVAERTPGQDGHRVLAAAAERAIASGDRLLGYFGTRGGHLPFQTADGNFNPTFDVKGTERYTGEDLAENPTLADMTEVALKVLSAPVPPNDDEQTIPPFWLLVEAGDVDWANHANNLDNSIGAVLSGAAAFSKITQWAEEHDAWDDTVVLVTSDHGHFLVLEDLQAIADAARSE